MRLRAASAARMEPWRLTQRSTMSALTTTRCSAPSRATGPPQLSPVTVGVDDAGHVMISTRQTAYKVRHVRRDPRVWLCAFPDRFFGRWVQIEGTAEIVELPEAMDGLVDYYRRISGEHPDWDDYRAAMERDKRVSAAHQRASQGRPGTVSG